MSLTKVSNAMQSSAAVSVKDYGAVGDGVTDDTAAIQAAEAASDDVFFPAGDYLVSSFTSAATTWRFASGARLVIGNGVTVTLDFVDIAAGLHKIFTTSGTGVVKGMARNPFILPEWWGAISDGLHPPVASDYSARAAAAARNAPALQAALTFAGNQYSITGLTGTVQLTYGAYVYDTTLSIPHSVSLVGHGINSGLHYYKGTGNAVEMSGTNNSLVSDVFIAPIAGPTWNYTTGYGLYINNVSTPIVRNTWCSQFGNSNFYIESTIEGRFYGLISDNANGGAFNITGVGQGSVFENCITSGTSGGHCFNIHDGYDWTLIGCVAKDGTTGQDAYYLNAVENINLIGCGCHDIRQHGFNLTVTASNCNLTNCFVNECSAASAGTYHGFQIYGTKNKLTGCKCYGNTINYGYALVLGGSSTDCASVNHNFKAGTVGTIYDGQPIGSHTYHISRVTTTDATVTTLFSKALNNNMAVTMKATVVGRQGTAGGAIATYDFWALAKTDSGGTAFSAGPTSLYSYESSAGLDATFSVTDATANAGVVALRITGLAATTIHWEAVVTVTSVTG